MVALFLFFFGVVFLLLLLSIASLEDAAEEEEEDNPLLLGLVEVSPAPMLHTDIVPSFEPTTVTAVQNNFER